MARRFGTDGVRGVANGDLLPEEALALGRALASLAGGGRPARVLVGRDTRLSGDMLQAALLAGLTSAGTLVEELGILPTAAVARLTRDWQADAGVMISASHNPVEDNGIKVFAPTGRKFRDEEEERLESLWRDAASLPRPTGTAIGRVLDARPAARSSYLADLRRPLPDAARDLSIVADLAHGSATAVAKDLFASLDLSVVFLNDSPDGGRINVACGATHPRHLAEEVLRRGADLGLAFDGDADRLIAVDGEGQVADGDVLLYILAPHLQRAGRLPGDRLALTVMSNLGLRHALSAMGIESVETPVGDRYVQEVLWREGLNLGGESSGHIIFRDRTPSGDGLLTALELIAALAERGQSLAELRRNYRPFPQRLKNVRVDRKEALLSHPNIQGAVQEAAAALGDRGRIFVRPSGTEPLIRVMAEGPDAGEVDRLVDRVCRVIEETREDAVRV